MTWSYSCVNRTRSILQKANLYPQLDSLSFTCVTGTTWQLASIWTVVLCFLYILFMHWACGKIVLQWMLMGILNLFSRLWSFSTFWQLMGDLSFSVSRQKTTSDSFKFRALNLVEKRRKFNLQSSFKAWWTKHWPPIHGEPQRLLFWKSTMERTPIHILTYVHTGHTLCKIFKRSQDL